MSGTIGQEFLDVLISKNLSVGYVLLYKTNYENQYSGFTPLFMSWSKKVHELNKKKATTKNFETTEDALVLKKLNSMSQNVAKVVA
jgi:hypothetical protein